MSLRDMMERRPHWVFFFAPKLYVIPFKAMSMDLDHPKFGAFQQNWAETSSLTFW